MRKTFLSLGPKSKRFCLLSFPAIYNKNIEESIKSMLTRYSALPTQPSEVLQHRFNWSEEEEYFESVSKTFEMTKLDFSKIGVYNDLKRVSSIMQSVSSQPRENEVETFIRSVILLYVGNFVFKKIGEDITKRTKISILKGDYFFSQGLVEMSSLGNFKLLEHFIKIGCNFNEGKYVNPLEDLNQYIITNYMGFFYFTLL